MNFLKRSMTNSRGITFGIGSTVRYQMPIDGVDTGIVKDIDGAYIAIEFTLDPYNYVIDRYENEILECLNTI
jgi:hypothetical protein